MRLRGTDFGHVLCASGAMGFFGEGYAYHQYMKPFGLDFDGCTFVAKTTTLEPRQGNMRLSTEDGITPLDKLPDCIIAKPQYGIALNSVGLSGPGARALFDSDRWQKRTKPFLLSFMSVEATPKDRLKELAIFVARFQERLPGFKAPVCLQINFSCPNVAHSPGDVHSEILHALRIAGNLGIPLMPKVSVTTPADLIADISDNSDFDAVCISNTVPFGALPDKIDWKRYFGTEKSSESPLTLRGYTAGGLSGKPLLPLVEAWVKRFVSYKTDCAVNAGGGILSTDDVDRLYCAGADSVFIGSMAFLRPHRVQKVIRYANRLFDDQALKEKVMAKYEVAA